MPSDNIAAIDTQIAQLIRRRGQLVTGGDAEIDAASVDAIQRHIRSVCDALLRPTNVCFLGPQFSYSHLAAIKYFGDAAQFTPVASIAAVFDAARRDPKSRGIVPIENSTDGRVVDTLGRMIHCDVSIIGEVALPIHHNLMSKTPRGEITEIHSKPQALSQCRRWLADQMPDARLVETNSTAGAAQLAAQRPGVAAVASFEAGRQYDLNIVAKNIEDNPNNVTRFVILGHDAPMPTGNDKTSLVCQVLHQPGKLADLMTTFKTHELNMTWIESFPIPGRPNEYFFFIEFDGHRDDANVKDALEQLERQASELKILGSYQKGDPALS
ncbi:prephenate dehydratase [Crateriforma conspicua]|uniref:prephenate dehydratase n=1 Tax=Crateriforma conspicua TaxID=2527996 RepID=A0A5C5XZ66_9PLAN|nr:prephenate dehydratase [Crateriforma conspicua]QDV62947.1 P-protein [Crateriforma conspicua]TWT68280.1 P-protein [Crateriforma conspicua]